MSRSFALLACLFIVVSAVPARAAPQDSPGTIYIDGVACNLACQAYLAWSRQVLSQHTARAPSQAQRPARVAQPPARSKPQRVVRLPEPRPSDLASSRTATKIAPAKVKSAPPIAADPPSARDEAKASPGSVPAAPAASASSDPDAAGAQDQVVTVPAPAAPAPDIATAPPEPQQAATNKEVPDQPAPNTPADDTTAALASHDRTEMVAILLVRPDIKTTSDLANKVVAVDDAPAEYSVADLRKAIAAAGATEVELVEDKKAALVRIIDGEVPAAVVSVMSSKAAELWNAGLSGFNVLWIPLPSASETSKRG